MGRRTAGRSGTRSNEQASVNILHSIHIPGAKHYKVKKDGQVYVFSGLTKKQFKEKNSRAKVVGYFTNKKMDAPGLVGRFFEIAKLRRGTESKVDFEVYNSHKKLKRTVCYVPISNDEFLVYEKYPVGAYGTVAASLALAFLIGYFALADSPINPLGIASTVTIGGDNTDTEVENEMIDFAGYDEMTVTANNPYVLLQNPESNDVYFSYVISDSNGKEIMTTDLIPPGKALQWSAKNDLGGGSHVVNMHVDTYDMDDTSIPYNGMEYQEVKINCE